MSTPIAPVHRVAADGCPGALQVHQAADGGLARVRLPGGVVNLTQWSTLHAVAPTGLELTSRANVQIRGLPPSHSLADRLAAVGLLPSSTHERVRNIVASPLSFSPLVPALDAALCASAELAALPGRFLFAIDDGSADVSGLGADVTAYPVGSEYALLLAGAEVGLRVPASAVVPAMLAAARAFLAERGDSGAWRLAELPDGARRVAAHLNYDVRQETVGAAVLTPQPYGPVGVLARPDGSAAVGAVAPLGRLSPAQLLALGSVAGAPGLVITPWRGVIVAGLRPSDAPAVRGALRAAGLITDPASPWARASACTGAPGCAKSLADVRADAVSVLPAAGGPRPVHFSGCSRHCGRPAGDVVEVLALGPGRYQVDQRIHRNDELPAAVAAARRTP